MYKSFRAWDDSAESEKEISQGLLSETEQNSADTSTRVHEISSYKDHNEISNYISKWLTKTSFSIWNYR